MSENKISHQPYQMNFKKWGELEGREKLVGSGTRGPHWKGLQSMDRKGIHRLSMITHMALCITHAQGSMSCLVLWHPMRTAHRQFSRNNKLCPQTWLCCHSWNYGVWSTQRTLSQGNCKPPRGKLGPLGTWQGSARERKVPCVYNWRWNGTAQDFPQIKTVVQPRSTQALLIMWLSGLLKGTTLWSTLNCFSQRLSLVCLDDSTLHCISSPWLDLELELDLQ